VPVSEFFDRRIVRRHEPEEAKHEHKQNSKSQPALAPVIAAVILISSVPAAFVHTVQDRTSYLTVQ
jgi:Na+-transporting methylmalonyl-CoA/oxaloacetate decarboxylase gamma subunit